MTDTGPVMGTIYLLHADRPGPGGARHYIGWTRDLHGRLRAHRSGRGSSLTAAWRYMQICWGLAWSVPGSRAEERRLHRRHQAARLCPVCRPAALDRHAAGERAARAHGRRPRASRAGLTG